MPNPHGPVEPISMDEIRQTHHNHFSRDVKSDGTCIACTYYIAYEKVMRRSEEWA